AQRHGVKDLLRKIGVEISWVDHLHPEHWSYDDVLYKALWPQGRPLSSCGPPSPWSYVYSTLRERNKKLFTKEESPQTLDTLGMEALSTTPHLDPEDREGHNTKTGLPLKPPGHGHIRSGSIFDCGSTGVVAALGSHERSSVDDLADCIRCCRVDNSKGWRFKVERRGRDDNDSLDEPYNDVKIVSGYLWLEKTTGTS
ncbi:MAG: hypothetical protein Q9218_008403, partial [Villophora microphyllina]